MSHSASAERHPTRAVIMRVDEEPEVLSAVGEGSSAIGSVHRYLEEV